MTAGLMRDVRLLLHLDDIPVGLDHRVLGTRLLLDAVLGLPSWRSSSAAWSSFVHFRRAHSPLPTADGAVDSIFRQPPGARGGSSAG